MRETSTEVAVKLIVSTNYPLYNSKEYSILEPSAGEGFLANKIKEFFPKSKIECIELNLEKWKKLLDNGFHSIHGDFLKLDFGNDKYDLIFAAPPFKGNVDLEHIMKMYDLLNDTGEIVSLTSPYWFTNNEPLQIKFREWLSDKPHKIQMLPDMSFSEREKTVPTAIINIYKWRP